ncbi:ribosome maturation factor RimM [Alkalicella caledoniensis]|uniref:Ribosome maturation factor RimM n=1 Tax=Alkalicella caledoniensis TaxID=2731377 RepID=A0A7G9WCH2_ALKCA|nr:ribosome maturation factor RimM [Alkalicella caledoniensis]QNO16384.1 ribosome maturation factor RimM [Alkalicella caledoniensis]
MEQKIKVGKITSTHGVRGEVKIYPLSDISTRFEKGSDLILGNLKLTIEKSRPHKNMFIIKFKGYDNINDILEFVGNYLEINKRDVAPLPEGQYYLFDIIDCEVYTDDDVYIGKVESVIETGSNDVYVIKNGSKEVLIPAIRQVVSKVDIDNKKITITPLEGLLE